MTPFIIIAVTIGSLVAFWGAWAVVYVCGAPFRDKYKVSNDTHKYLCCTFGMMSVVQWLLILFLGGF